MIINRKINKDVLHLCRCGAVTLNQWVQVGRLLDALGDSPVANVHTTSKSAVPRSINRDKAYYIPAGVHRRERLCLQSSPFMKRDQAMPPFARCDGRLVLSIDGAVLSIAGFLQPNSRHT